MTENTVSINYKNIHLCKVFTKQGPDYLVKYFIQIIS